MECKFCNGKCNMAGRQKNVEQRYYCKRCKKYQQNKYRYGAYRKEVVALIPDLVCESVSIRGIAKLLKIGLTTVIRKIKLVASELNKPAIPINKASFTPVGVPSKRR